MRTATLSIRARLTLWHAAVLSLIVFVFSAGIFLFVKLWLYRGLDIQLGRDLATAERVFRLDPGDVPELESRIGFKLFEVTENGKLLYRSGQWERSGLDGAVRGGGAPAPRSWIAPDGQRYRVGEFSAPSFHAALALDESSVTHMLWTLAIILSVGAPIAIGLAIAGGYFLAGRVLAPIGAMAERARKITAESLGERLPAGNPADELGRLASVFNDALARVHASFEQLRQFTADASHELRTPLATMRSVGEVALQKIVDTAARDTIEGMLEEIDRLTQLVESLLTITRAESGALDLKRKSVDLANLAASVADQLRILAEEKQQSLHVDAAVAVLAECDPAILGQGLMNLLHNAIKYTPSRGEIRVEVRRISSTDAAIEIRDTGPGIPAMHHARVFGRFYRVDEGRSRGAGGVGLGLAIARWAIEANGGRIELESEAGQGSLFRIVLPLATNT